MTDPPSVILYPFRKRDPLTGKWYRARWKKSLDEIERNVWVVDGPAQTFAALGPTSSFQAKQSRRLEPSDRVEMQRRWEHPPAIDALERFLAITLLRRCATYCVRRRRFAQAQGAAGLYRELGSAQIP